MGRSEERTYRSYILRKWLIIAAMLLALAAVSFLSLLAGSSSLTFADIFHSLTGQGSREQGIIIWNIRMPRIAAAIAVGAALSLSGCIMQCVLHNPLASSSTLGVSQGASFGAALALISIGAGTTAAPWLVTASAFAGGIATTIAMLVLSRLRISTPSSMILAGVAISSMFSGATTLIQYSADDTMVASIVYWTFGNLGRASWSEIAMIASASLLSFSFFMLNRWNYNAIGSGRHTAKSLGVNTGFLIPMSLALCALMTSVAVAFTGCISFIGLIAPHAVRKLVGNDFRFLIPGSAIAGAILLLASDIACRTAAAPIVLPVGALTSFIGAPIFLCLILRERRKA